MQEINNSLKGRDFISIHDFSPAEIAYMLEVGAVLKQENKQGIVHHHLAGKTLGMIFQKASTRTRVAFEVGMYQLGGHALFLSPRDIQLGRGETIQDTAQVLSRMLDGIMIRTFDHEEVLELAKWADIPIINGLTDLLHPTQVIGDLMTIQEHKGRLQGLKLAFIGDGNNVVHSLLFGGAKVGMDVVVATPPGFEPDPHILSLAQQDAQATGAKLWIVNDLAEAAQELMFSTLMSGPMGQEDGRSKEQKFLKYQINQSLCLWPTRRHCHALPARQTRQRDN